MNYNGYIKIQQVLQENVNCKWIVTEKIHGSCFCFIYDIANNNIEYAKRNKILSNDENFFGYKTILPEYLPKIKNIFNSLKDTENIKQIHIYGELFGGIYPNIEITNQPIQKGVYYSNNIHFMAFDISYITNTLDEQYLDYYLSLELFKKANILHAEPLEIFSSYNKAIEYKLGFNSTIPKKLGLPELKNNKAEGIIVRSLINHHIIKIKIPEFSESKYSENDYIQDNKNQLYYYKQESLNHITLNRLNNAISKIGEFNENKDEIIDLFVEDIIIEINAYTYLNMKLIEDLKSYIKISATSLVNSLIC